MLATARAAKRTPLDRPIEAAELALKVLSGHTKPGVQDKAERLLAAALDDLLQAAGLPAKED